MLSLFWGSTLPTDTIKFWCLHIKSMQKIQNSKFFTKKTNHDRNSRKFYFVLWTAKQSLLQFCIKDGWQWQTLFIVLVVLKDVKIQFFWSVICFILTIMYRWGLRLCPVHIHCLHAVGSRPVVMDSIMKSPLLTTHFFSLAACSVMNLFSPQAAKKNKYCNTK